MPPKADGKTTQYIPRPHKRAILLYGYSESDPKQHPEAAREACSAVTGPLLSIDH